VNKAISDWRPTAHQDSGTLAALLPGGFAAYGRILHPFRGADSERNVSWVEVAKWSGKRVHRLAQAPAISEPRATTSGHRPTEYDEPLDGLSSDQLLCLLPHLTRATERADSCTFGVWAGYGEFHEGAVSKLMLTNETTHGTSRVITWLKQAAADVLFRRQGETHVAAAPPVTVKPKKFSVPDREFYMFKAPLSIAPTFTQHVFGVNDYRLDGTEAPNIWWPDDEAWLIYTDIDLASSYIGGTVELVDAILADPGLEAFPANLSDSVRWDSDTVNQ
jgi:hypothetical protein